LKFQVTREAFLEILEKFGLKLEASLLDAFLLRIGLQNKDSHASLIPYKLFLEKFQNRNEDSSVNKSSAG
jgi:hypothetical protein